MSRRNPSIEAPRDFVRRLERTLTSVSMDDKERLAVAEAAVVSRDTRIAFFSSTGLNDLLDRVLPWTTRIRSGL